MGPWWEPFYRALVERQLCFGRRRFATRPDPGAAYGGRANYYGNAHHFNCAANYYGNAHHFNCAADYYGNAHYHYGGTV